MNKKYQELFSPYQIGKLEIKNRFNMAPMGPFGMSDEHGAFNQKAIEYYVERAKGGTGLITTGICYVENEIEKCAMPSLPSPTQSKFSFLYSAKRLTERVHAHGSKIFLQLTAGFGRVALPLLLEGEAVAPSKTKNRFNPDLEHRELTTEEVETMVKKFAESAAIAKMAGFDGVEIHAVHEGYLLDQFTMEIFNQRTDKYGGDFESRMRFPVEILQAIKNQCGEDYPVSLRYSVKSYIKNIRKGGLPGEDFEEKGRDLKEGLKAAKYLEEAGYDAFNADAGSYDSWYWNHPPMYFKDGMYLDLSQKLKEVVDVPVIVAGRMDNPDLAVEALKEEKADMIGLGRPLLADPELPNKIKNDDLKSIRPCLSCHDGCMGRVAEGGPVSCAVNPQVGREKIYNLEPALESKDVLVIGGGLAGMEAARVCAERGHNVKLVEKADQLGGNIIPGSVPEFKKDDRKLVKWYENELAKKDITVNLNTEADKEMIKKQEADSVILATGSEPKNLNLNNQNNSSLTASEVLLGAETGEKLMVVGGGLVGCETALWLAQEKDKEVILIEQLEEILESGPELPFMNEDMLTDLLAYHEVEIITGAQIEKVNDKEVIIKSDQGKEKKKVDNIITAIGYSSNDSLYHELQSEINNLHLLGDAKKVENIMYAIWDAYELARTI